ncbi:hypothetical protein [Chitinophaga eiseniae]|uniref:hypothetical protein n=1 Tax=Chitinophaga eiseniae TaxID=634771 RepID=UPI00099919E3|nr:hypothetical protein [Chitinophaga eiseniae]
MQLDVRGEFSLGVLSSKGGQAYSIGLTRAGAQLYGVTSIGLRLGGTLNSGDAAILPNGNVGIGTTSPGLKLDVNGVFRSNGMVTLLGPGTASELNSTTKRGVYIDNGVSTGWDLLTLRNDSGTMMTVTGAGSVGIGTKKPLGYKLAVEGTIAARRVKVTQESWADYVFLPDYKLPSIEELERYIVSKGHLPGVPSAEEVKSDGVDLGEMNKILLEKVEELSLYIISLKKQLDVQQSQISALQQKQ